jgi:hypothetical protein
LGSSYGTGMKAGLLAAARPLALRALLKPLPHLQAVRKLQSRPTELPPCAREQICIWEPRALLNGRMRLADLKRVA